MDITKMITSAIGDSLSSNLGIDSSKTSGIIDTISGVLSKNGIEEVDNSGADITSALESDNGLSSDLAGKVTDMVLPLIINAVKSGVADKLGDVAGGFLNKLKF